MNSFLSAGRSPALFATFALSTFSSAAVTFTNDTLISFNNTNFDQTDIVVTNCVLTVDGPHAFASLQLLSGATLTHSFSANGLLDNRRHISAEPYELNGTNASTLPWTNVDQASVVVRDATGLVFYTNSVDYLLGLTPSGFPTVERTASSSIPDGATVLLDYDLLYDPVPAGLNLIISNDVLVSLGAAIRADGNGYGGGQGPGQGFSSAGAFPAGGGASHGGFGGIGSGVASLGASYDTVTQPVLLGSGGGAGFGGPGAAGGGSIKLTVGGLIQIDGVISANGADALNDRSGGGAGGSIWLTADVASGNGTISANGGAGDPTLGGGGGAGRVALQVQVDLFGGDFRCHGGLGFQNGGPGTICIDDPLLAEDEPLLALDNAMRIGAPATLVSCPTNVFLIIQGGSVVQPAYGLIVKELLIKSNSWLSTLANVPLNFTVTGGAQIDAGSGIDLDGLGYPSGQGNGFGSFASFIGGGAGHGAYGGDGGPRVAGTPSPGLGGFYYDAPDQPSLSGSGGGGTSSYPGGAGGGVLRMVVTGTLLLNGSISADASAPQAYGTGGGSGGSLWLTLGTLAGSGRLSAIGSSATGFYGGGGSGGRIAVYYDTNQFTGTIAAQGGSGYVAGGAGTIYLKNSADPVAQLVLDNAGLAGTNTSLTPIGTIDLTVQAGASAIGLSTLRNLTIGPNGFFAPVSSTPASTVLAISGDAIVNAGGVLSLKGLGYPALAGSGAGHYYNSGTLSSGSGAGHGGYGGNGAASTTYTLGGNAYGVAPSPSIPGSGGGGNTSANSFGGAGGGYLRLNVNRLLRVDGLLSVDGLPGGGNGAGGGSGGALYLSCQTLAGSGLISANGGPGDLPNGGGGAGGRIAAFFFTNRFTGTFSAAGAPGFAGGGAGTIYLKANTDSYAQAIIDNGGLLATNTPLSGLALADLTVRGGAKVTGLQSGSFRNVIIASNSTLATATLSETWIISGNATVQTGGKISTDGLGYSYNQRGQGSANYSISAYAGGGGGHGGFGGIGSASAPSAGGTGYFDISQAAFPGGSGGISYYNYLPDAAGGGALWLRVSGLLTIDGRLSADGNSSFFMGDGGGAGGGLQLTVGRLAGSGTISACGGTGDLPNGGGGGGGCIAIYYQSNSFAGTITAKGGLGFASGGAGTIYTKQNFQSSPQILVDNEGLRGTNTFFSFLSGINYADLTIRRGAILALAGSGTLNTLRVETNSAILVTNQSLTINHDASILAGAAVLADGTGYGPATGPGAGSSYAPVKGGASHGGLGGANQLPAYDSYLSPIMLGSGGGNGSGSTTAPFGGVGGGAFRLNVLGTFALDGMLSANGLTGAANSGGGAGGSISVTARTLTGKGAISANGGPGNNGAGGGSGGRIALSFYANPSATNLFAGTVSACGGGGTLPGGAGTVYTAADSLGGRTRLRIDNAGFAGANTPVTLSSPLDLTVSGAAVVTSSSLLVSNLVVDYASTIAALPGSNLDLLILHNALVQTGATLNADAKGFGLASGPGAGASASGYGSGGGYGGPGGASAAAAGGPAYGSPTSPLDLGSGGGAGSVIGTGGSQGGGAVRLSVGGTLTLDGTLSANGNSGLQDSAGGGAGGSLWLTAGSLLGSGLVSAQGGDGDYFGGGGGGGGRIALYSLSNDFTGALLAGGGSGYNAGGTGTVVTASYLGNLQVLSQTPAGLVSNAVSTVTLNFNNAVDPNTFSAADVQLTSPIGPVAQDSFVVQPVSSTSYRVTFPQQTAVGDYLIEVGPAINDLFGFPMLQTYTNSFTVSLPVIQGTVTDTNGQPVAGVLIQPNGPVSAATTDTNGLYTIGAPPDTAFVLIPQKSGLYIIPGSRGYANVSASLTNENYLAVTSLTGDVLGSVQDTNFVLRCYGYSGVNYQVLTSPDLVYWYTASDPLPGTNGPLTILIPFDAAPAKFFRIQARD